MRNNTYYVYILFNKANGVLYTGVTNDLSRRIAQHKSHEIKGFTAKYNIDKLGHMECFNDINDAIKREKQIKAGSRDKKIALIESTNPNWDDLSVL